MSYVVVCNAENEDTFNNGGFSDPASFTNFYKSPLQIEPDSEVAVESVKIDRAAKWSIKDTDTFFVYYGPEQISGKVFENSGDVPKNAVRIKIAKGAYNKDQFVAAIKRAINQAPLGPLLFNNCDVTDSVDSSSNKFNGFQFKFTSRGAGVNVAPDAAGTNLLVNSMFEDANPSAVSFRNDPGQGGGTPAYSYDSVSKRLACNSTKSNPTFYDNNIRFLAPAIKINHPQGPISPINGEFIAGFHSVKLGDWCVGLSRPTTPYWRSGFPSFITAPPNGGNANAADRAEFCYMDYWIQYKRGGAGSLRIYQWGGTTSGAGVENWAPKELPYFQAANIGGDHITGSVLNTANLKTLGATGVKFLLDGDELKLRLVVGGSVATAVTIVVGGTGYNDDVYTDVPTIPGGSGGEGATLDITVVGGVITSAVINHGGFGYTTGEQLIPSDIIGNGNGDLKLNVSAISATGADIKLISTGSNTLKKYNYIPLHNGTEALVPVVQLNQKDDFLTIDHLSVYTDANMSKWKYPTATNTNLNNAYRPIGNGTIVPGSDWYSQNENVSGNRLNFNARRPSIAYQLVGGSGGAGSFKYANAGSASYIPAYLPVMVLGEEERDPDLPDYSQILYYIPDPGEGNYANMGRNLGFGSFSTAVHSEFGGSADKDNVTTLNSIEAGAFTVHSAFVRINDLPIQSFNGATSSRSNILYHIPRFSSDGRSFGELFFQAPEKTYIALNNTDKIMISQLAIDIVGRNERLVNDLQGASIVCLHIRPRRK